MLHFENHARVSLDFEMGSLSFLYIGLVQGMFVCVIYRDSLISQGDKKWELSILQLCCLEDMVRRTE